MRALVMECNQRIEEFPAKDVEIQDIRDKAKQNAVRAMLYGVLTEIGVDVADRSLKIFQVGMLYNSPDISSTNQLTINEVEALASLAKTHYLGDIKNFVSSIRHNRTGDS